MHNFYNPNQNLIQVSAQNNVRAALFVFPPLARAFANQMHRPLTYNISEDVFHTAQDAAARVNMGKSPVQAIEHVLNGRGTLASIMPSIKPTVAINLSELSTTWKFMLVVNGEQSAPGEVSMWSRPNDVRSIYFGYFVDEPINPMSLGFTTPTVNDHARLVITHKTHIQALPAHNAHNSGTRYATMYDADIVDPALATLLSSAALQISDPLHLQQSSDFSTAADGTIMSSSMVTDYNNLSNVAAAVVIDSRLHNPQENLAALMNAAMLANLKLQSNEQLNRGGSSFIDNMSRSDVIGESLLSYHQLRTSTVKLSGLNPDSVHTMATVRQTYRPDIFPVGSDSTTMLSPHDQNTNTASTMFCSLLCSAIPPLLVQAQLLHFAFQYESQSRNTMSPHNWQVYETQTTVPMSDQQIQLKVRAVMTALETGLFRMLCEGRGDFSVHGSFGIANVSHCYLNFYCDSGLMRDPYEVPTIFGGLTSSLMADLGTTYNNTSQYGQLMNAMTGGELQNADDMMRDTAPYFVSTGAPAELSSQIIPPSLIRL